MTAETVRADHRAILDLIEPQSSVLDLGCGNGDLLALLTRQKKCRGQGIEIDDKAIYQCVAKGLNVFHGDIDTGLSEFRDKAFDYVILNQSLQQIMHVDKVVDDALRVGRKVLVGFPNFAYYRARLQIFFLGRTPVTDALPYEWHETPNLHFLSISDFTGYCRRKKLTIERKIFLSHRGHIHFFPNVFARTGLFLISA